MKWLVDKGSGFLFSEISDLNIIAISSYSFNTAS